MNIRSTSTARSQRFRARRLRAVVMVAPVEVGMGGIELLVANGLLKPHETRDRKAVGKACLGALEQWATGRVSQGPWRTDHGAVTGSR